MRRCLMIAVCSWLLPVAVFALSDEFAAALSLQWAPPSTPLTGSSATAPVFDRRAADGGVLELVYPGRTEALFSGPGWSTEVETATANGYGVYEARLRPAKASRRAGVVSALFTYFNDGNDYDHDGIADNHEIDFEFLAAEPSAIYMTVWTAYEASGGSEVFRKVTRKVDVASGQVWQTPPGGEGTYDLVEIAPLPWSYRRFKSGRRFYTYRFDWEPTQVSFTIDLEDGQGTRTLWVLSGAPDSVIPSHPAPCLLNLWHNATHWNSGLAAEPPRRAAQFRIDRITTP